MGLLFVLGMFLICWIFNFLDGSSVFVMMDASVMFLMVACFFVFLLFCVTLVVCWYMGGVIHLLFVLLIFMYISFNILLCFLSLLFFFLAFLQLSLCFFLLLLVFVFFFLLLIFVFSTTFATSFILKVYLLESIENTFLFLGLDFFCLVDFEFIAFFEFFFGYLVVLSMSYWVFVVSVCFLFFVFSYIGMRVFCLYLSLPKVSTFGLCEKL